MITTVGKRAAWTRSLVKQLRGPGRESPHASGPMGTATNQISARAKQVAIPTAKSGHRGTVPLRATV